MLTQLLTMTITHKFPSQGEPCSSSAICDEFEAPQDDSSKISRTKQLNSDVILTQPRRKNDVFAGRTLKTGANRKRKKAQIKEEFSKRESLKGNVSYQEAIRKDIIYIRESNQTTHCFLTQGTMTKMQKYQEFFD